MAEPRGNTIAGIFRCWNQPIFEPFIRKPLYWTHPMHILETASENEPARVEPMSFAKASIGFVTSTLAVSSLMVLLGSL